MFDISSGSYCDRVILSVVQVFLPFALVQLGNAMVSMRRLNQFLVMEERSDEVEKLDTPGANIDDADFFWAEPPKPRVCGVSCMKFIAPYFSALPQLPPWEVPLCETCRSLRPSDDAHLPTLSLPFTWLMSIPWGFQCRINRVKTLFPEPAGGPQGGEEAAAAVATQARPQGQ